MTRLKSAVRRIEDKRAELYLAAVISVIVVAVLLRFYELAENSLWLDEAVAANNARGTFSDFIWMTRHRNSSPVLYPLILFAVQKLQSTTFSLRLVPALCSVAAIAAMPLLLTRYGIERRAAWLMALLSALSTAAITQARDAREYSVDVLIAVLLIAGLFAFLKENKKSLLCVSLFVAPLLQYNLVLFGAVVLGTAALHSVFHSRIESHFFDAPENTQPPRWTETVWPLICFIAGCALTVIVTLRFQWSPGGWGSESYLSSNYFLPDNNVWLEIPRFIGSSTWQLIEYHLPPYAALVGAVAVGLHWAISIAKREFSPVMTLGLLAVFVAIGAAFARAYPLGAIRQCLYLGPVIFLSVAQAMVWILDCAVSRKPPAWKGSLGMMVVAGSISYVGAIGLLQSNLYEDRQPIKAILDIVEEDALSSDLVFVSGGAAPAVKFHRQRRLHYHFGRFESSFQNCLDGFREVWANHEPTTVWLVDSHYPVCQGWHVLELVDERFRVENRFMHASSQLRVAHFTDTTLNRESASQDQSQDPLVRIEELLAGLQPAHSDRYDVFFHDRKLILAARQCTPQDALATVRVEAAPAEADQPTFHGNFSMQEYAFRIDATCVAVYPIRDPALRRIGMYISLPGQADVWHAEFELDAVPRT